MLDGITMRRAVTLKRIGRVVQGSVPVWHRLTPVTFPEPELGDVLFEGSKVVQVDKLTKRCWCGWKEPAAECIVEYEYDQAN